MTRALLIVLTAIGVSIMVLYWAGESMNQPPRGSAEMGRGKQ